MAAIRRHDIDWLRVLATYLLFAFHTAKVFDVRPLYHVKNAELSAGLGYFTGFVHQWHMPLFFLLAGWSAAGSVRLRGVAGFVRERSSRLLVPLAFGLIAFGPVLRWIELRTGQFYTTSGRLLPADPDIGFLTFLPRYFAVENLTWAHLWFLAYLFTFSVLYLPLVARLVRRAPVHWTAPASVVYLPIVPLALIQVTLRPRWPGFQNLVDDWANFAYYSCYFLLGTAPAYLPLLERRVQREAGRAAALALVAYAGLILTEAHGWTTANLMLTAVASWCTVVGVLGAAARWLDVSNAALRWLAESAFPVYVLHQIAVAGLAFLVIGAPLGIPAKFAIVMVGAVVLTLAAYQLLVRPFGPMRFLLGMKGQPPPAHGGRAATVQTALPADR
ncbi:MAG TPA: acyltransferase [Candidatus Binatia bacterium]|jgi:peptidoglycan/LPS O-acetylase OafA/YrhL|nr:acyltransferase [Candidatus Binatia bacterium]